MSIIRRLLRGAPEGVTLVSIAVICGDETAIALAAALGGRRVHVPLVPTDNHILSQVVGLKAAERLASHYGGVTFTVAREYGRRERIVALRKEGKPVSEIARVLGCTERHVYHKLAEARDIGEIPPREMPGFDPSQQDLFGA